MLARLIRAAFVPPITGLTVTIPAAPGGMTQLQLNWTNGSPHLPIEVFRNGVAYSTRAAGQTGMLDSGLSANTSYTYAVRHVRNGSLGIASSNSNTTLDHLKIDCTRAAPTT